MTPTPGQRAQILRIVGPGLVGLGAVIVTGAAGGEWLAAGLGALAIAAAAAVAAARTLDGGAEASDGARPGLQDSDPAARLGGLLAALPDPILLVSAPAEDGGTPRVAFANAAAQALFGVTAADPPLASMIRHPAALEAIDQALAGADAEAEIETGRAQDRVWTLIARHAPPQAAEGRAALVVLHDETAARRVERKRVDFIANASHELRTPLASLTGFIETLRGPARDDEAARERFLGIMAAQADRMRRLVEDLLSLSRIELNEHVAPEGEVDLAAAVRDVLDALGPDRDGHRAEIVSLLPANGRAVVRGDRDQLIQVIQNLVDNALKYAGADGRVTVEVAADLDVEAAAAARRGDAVRVAILKPDHAGAERYAALRVSDTGPGIPREVLPRLSERFYRAPGQKSGDRSGTGLGLAIVKHILNRHKGGLTVESAVGHGAAFTAYAPMSAVTKP